MSALPITQTHALTENNQDQSLSILNAIDHGLAVIEFSPDGAVLFANMNFLTLFGYSQDLIGQNHSQLCTAEMVDSEEYQEFWKALQAGELKQGEFMRLSRQGHPVWLLATYTPVLNTEGKVYKIIQFASDITNIKSAALENEGKVAAISRSQGIIEFDLAGNILDANDNFLNLTGYTLDEIKDLHHRIFVDKDEVDGGAYRIFWQKLGKGEFHSGEFLRFGKNGKRIWMQATYNPIFDLEGQPVRIVKYCTDSNYSA